MSTLPATQTGLRPTSVPLTSAHKPLEAEPAALGQMADCTHMLHDVEALNAHMRDEGYLLLRGFHDQADVLAARLSMFERLAAEGHLDLNHPLAEGVAAPDAKVAFKYEIALKNPQVHNVVYGARMMAFFDRFLGGPARHFDYTWIRAVSPGLATPPHMDVVYMGRGTKRLYTVWTPYVDVPMEMGGLMVLERSHLNKRLVDGYGSKDVDEFCVNRRDPGYTRMGGGGNISDGGALSRDPITLRKRLGGRWLTTDYRMGDILIFSIFLVHASMDNHTDRLRLTSDTRYQLASEPVDERWIGENPIAHGPAGKRGMIC